MKTLSTIGPKLIFERGAQILRIPEGSRIDNIRLCGGAAATSRWAALRGSVLKFSPGRQETPVIITGHKNSEFMIPTGHVLMDRLSFEFTVNQRNAGQDIPHEIIRGIGSEDLCLIHASFSHPDQLFLAQGCFTQERFFKRDLYGAKHLMMSNGALYLFEDLIAPRGSRGSLNILDQFEPTPSTIKVQLIASGHIEMKNG